MKTIGLCLIVKNESRVIQRCLDAFKPLIDYVLIVDTGSEDDTIARIETWLEHHQVPGRVFQESWRDYAYNRSDALKKMREVDVDYVLMPDADEVLYWEPGADPMAFKSKLWADLYYIKTHSGSVEFFRPQLMSNRLRFYYVGVLHEFLDCHDPIESRQDVDAFYLRNHLDSHRNVSANKFIRDAEILKAALEDETDAFLISRYTFYLAQTLLDLERYEEALPYYERRLTQGFWEEERYWSLYKIAQIKQTLKRHPAHVFHAYLSAHEICPWRAEALHGAARFAREQECWQQAFLYAQAGLEIRKPAAALFSETWIYDYGLLDEYAVSAYYTGRYQASADACRALLQNERVPDDEIPRIRSNLNFALEKLSLSE